jgi:hypothetical protein
VRCKGFKTLNLPPNCPNCLSPVEGPMWGIAEYRFGLRLCPGCQQLLATRKKLALLLGVAPAVAVLAGAAVAGLFFGAPEWVFMVGLLAALVILVAGFAAAGLVILLKPVENGRISNFETFRVHRCGQKAFSDEFFFDLEFRNHEYVRLLMEANPGLEFICD